MALKIAVMGSGGVGGYFGGRLSEAGSDVTFIARGAHLAALQKSGLRIESRVGDVQLSPARAVADPAEAGTVDVVMFTVKLADTQSAAQAIKPLVERGASVFTFQNGIESAEAVGRIVGDKNVVPSSAQIGAVIREPGVIKHTGTMAKLTFGEAEGKPSARTEAFLAACKAAKFDSEQSPDITRAIWLKFALLAPFAGITTLTRSKIGPLRQNAEAQALLEEAVREAVAVGIALGKHLKPEDADRIIKSFATMPEDMTSSMCHDIMAGKPLEVGGLSGAVSRLGSTRGIPTPTHDFIVKALSVHAKGTPA
jgi:2-dehydropantoate 2-reductase